MTKHITPDKRFLRLFLNFFALLEVYDECRVKVSNISIEICKIIITCGSLLFFFSRFRRIFRLVRFKKDFPLLKIHVKDFSIKSAFTFGAMTSEMFRSVHTFSRIQVLKRASY
jgi:hypothetical protein